jgi:hypothetical protein
VEITEIGVVSTIHKMMNEKKILIMWDTISECKFEIGARIAFND